ncbi:MAG: DUF177 domain-containing protein [Bacillota bacterium]|nr:MAG: DUF177 domain-containing protein [Bacillota bacterium]
MTDPLVIDVEALTQQEGRQLQGEVEARIEPIDVPGGTIAASEPVRLRFRLTHTGERQLWLEARLTARARLTCDRCLEPFDTVLTAEYEELYRPRPEDAGPGDEPEDTGEARVIYYDEDVIDLREGIRQNLLLAMPLKQLCRDDCRGLCPHCGQNLNEHACDCEEDAGDPRLAALAEWLRRHGKEEEV